MYIAVAGFQIGSNPSAIYLIFPVISSGGTNTNAEVYLDDDATAAEMQADIAEAARQVCRANGENIDAGAPVTIFGGVVQAGTT